MITKIGLNNIKVKHGIFICLVNEVYFMIEYYLK